MTSFNKISDNHDAVQVYSKT